MKRGQLTIFILIAVILVFIILGIFLILNYSKEPKVGLIGDVETIQNFISECVDSTTKEALIVVSFQGGYYKKPSLAFSFSPTFFPYYYYEGQINLPTLEQIETQMSYYVNDKMLECLDSASFSNIDLIYSSPQTKVMLSKDNAYFEIDMPIELDSKEQKMQIDLKDFSKNHNSSLYEIYEVVKYITESHEQDPEFYCMNCVSEMLFERKLYMYTFPTTTDHATGIMIYENRTGISDPYAFIFFNKYTGQETTTKLTI